MLCPHCKKEETKYYRQIFKNGTVHVTERCPRCGKFPKFGQAFLPNDVVDDVNQLAVFIPEAYANYIGDRDVLPPELWENPHEKTKPKPIYWHWKK